MIMAMNFKINSINYSEVISVIKHIHNTLIKEFFLKDFYEITSKVQKEYSEYLGHEFNIAQIGALWNLGYLPIGVKSFTEKDKKNTIIIVAVTESEFYWIIEFLFKFTVKTSGKYILHEEVISEKESTGESKMIYENGKFHNATTLSEIRKKTKTI